MYSLSISHNQQTVDEYVLRHEIVTIGRGSDNDIQLIDTTISQRHAQLVVSPDTLIIEDMDSTNGTYINGLRIKKQQLKHGDRVMIGQHKLSFDNLGLPEDAGEQEPTLQMNRNTIEQILFDSKNSPLTPPPPPGSSKAINWVAQDQNGIWWGFEQQPVVYNAGWSNFQDTMKLKLKQESPNLEWRKTLHKI